MKHSGVAVAFAALSAVAFAALSMIWSGTVLAEENPPPAPASNLETYRQLQLFGEVFTKFRSEFADEVKDQDMVEAAVNGMLSALDPHSSYLNAKNFEEMQEQTRGEFGGLGMEVTMENGLLKVISPIDDTPASRAGLKPGDLITHLNGKPVKGLSLPEAVEKMRGPVDSRVTLTIRRKGRQPFGVTMNRAVIRIQSVKSRLLGDIGYIRITSFSEQTEIGLKTAIDTLKRAHGKALRGFVLDLRNNPGGLLDQAIAVADDFLDKGEIVSTRGRNPDEAQRFDAHPGDLAEGLPIVLLINGGSASASEIVAGALQDQRRAVLLGTRSFGKGSVQTVIPMPEHGAMRLTTSRYYTPSGRSIQAEGIEPDILVEQARIERPGAKPATPAKTTKSPEPNPDEDESSDAPALDPAEDYQLQRATDLLKGVGFFNLPPVK